MKPNPKNSLWLKISFNLLIALLLLVSQGANSVSAAQAGANHSAVTVATLIKPLGNISDNTPTYSWSRVNNAWLYQYQVLQGSTFRLIKWTNASVCTSTTCSVTPPAMLAYTGHAWRVRARIGNQWMDWTPWKSFTVVNGFNSQFDGSSPGWVKHPGAAWQNSSSTYLTYGLADFKTSSTSYNQDFSDFIYQARVKEASNASVDSYVGLVVRGTPTFDLNNDWENGYYFWCWAGNFAVTKIVGGNWYVLSGDDWIYSPSIAPNDWNTLKVVASGSILKFYINGNLVWSGTDSTFSSGRAGVFTFSYPSAKRVDIAWATLDASAVTAHLAAAADEQIEAGQRPLPFEPPSPSLNMKRIPAPDSNFAN
jgi:hypothetical protein